MLAALVLISFLVACGGGGADGATEVEEEAGPRPATAAEVERLARTGVDAHSVGVRMVDGTVISAGRTIRFSGWIHSRDHWVYVLVQPEGAGSFLTVWDPSSVSAVGSEDMQPPLPIPDGNWETTALDPEASHVAAAQVMLVSLADAQPENPQLLAQGGVTWIRSDRVGDTAVDVMGGPVPEGAEQSSLRYWVDGDGSLLRLEARLDGEHWSTFTFTDSPMVELDRPGT